LLPPPLQRLQPRSNAHFHSYTKQKNNKNRWLCVALERFVPPAILDAILALRAGVPKAFPLAQRLGLV
jgi:hypothetical protein